MENERIERILIDIKIAKDKKLSPASRDAIMKETEKYLSNLVELYSAPTEGWVGSGFNFLTNTRDFEIELGFDDLK